MSGSEIDTGAWLKPLGDIFLGLNTSAVIRRVFGAVEIAPDLQIAQLPGLSWREFVALYAGEAAQDGLNYAWAAMAKGHVAQAFWPLYLPFKPGVIARMRPVSDDPIVSFAIHLSPVREYNLTELISEPVLRALDIIGRVGNRIFSGMDGPLTDRQVRNMGQLVDHTDHIRQLLLDLRAEVLLPATTAPLPRSVRELFGCSKNDFSQRRITTHQLAIDCRVSDTVVYCQRAMRDSVFQIVDTLLTGIPAQSTITLTDEPDQDAQAVRLKIQYRTEEASLQVAARVDPITVADMERLSGMRTIQRLVTTAQALLRPVNGRVWAEPVSSETGAAQIVLVLPRWQGEVPPV